MKKILVLLMTLLLCLGCSNNKTEEKHIYKLINNASINDIDNKTPSEINISDNINGVGLNYYDEEALDIIEKFKQMTINEEVEFPDFTDYYSIQFYWDEDFCCVDFYDDVVCLCDEEGIDKFYKINDEANLLAEAKQTIIDNFNLNVEVVDVLDYEGLKVQQGSVDKEEGNVIVELQITNDSDKDYAISVVPQVNGYPIHSYQTLGCIANNSTGYYVQIPTETLALYGVYDIESVVYCVDVYDYDSENYEVKDYVTSSNAMEIKYDVQGSKAEKSDCLYEDDNVSVCVKLSEHEIYSCLNLFVENKSGVNKVGVSKVVLNGEAIDMTGYEEVYTLDVSDKAEMFALLPLSNYEYNEETYETKKIEIESLEIGFTVDGKETKTTVVK